MNRIKTLTGLLLILGLSSCGTSAQEDRTPNILFAISDDQSYPHLSILGDSTVLTPNIDALARRGVLFHNAFVAAPQCSPSRAAILTGQNIWQLEEAGTHSSYFPTKFPVFTTHLENQGYALGYTGKPWGPGNHEAWGRNPVGPSFNEKKNEPPYSGIRPIDYAANFADFLAQKDDDQPFFFWYGGFEPHRVFEAGSGIKEGKDPADVQVPDFLPDDSIVRNDLLDYAVEIQWFDNHLGKMLKQLEAAGELDNTIIVVTADNGMAFPAAKANLYEYGTHVPLVIAGPEIAGNRQLTELVSLTDLAPTFIEIAQAEKLPDAVGESLIRILRSEEISTLPQRQYVLSGRERHTHARPENLGYPARAIRTDSFLYINNLRPDRWPAGDPAVDLSGDDVLEADFKYMEGGYHDIDACPSKTVLLENSNKYSSYLNLAVAKRPADELFAILRDPGCTVNLAFHPEWQIQLDKLKTLLVKELTAQEDPRVLGTGDIFDSYPRFAKMRAFPGFRSRGEYNPAYQSKK